MTTHNKASSSAFLNLYTTLSDAPDPFPLLEASVESLVVQEDTLPKLESENADLKRRLQKTTKDLEELEQKLENETTARRGLSENSASRIKEVEESWEKVLEEKQNNWEAKEKALEVKVENQDRLLKEIKAGYDVVQKLNQKGDTAETANRAHAAELELVSTELERASSRLAELQARNEQLSLDLARAVTESQSQQDRVPLEDDPSFVRLQNQNSSLMRQVDSAKYDHETKLRDWEDKFRQSERQRGSLESAHSDLKAKLEQQSDYQELQRELQMLRSIELEANDDEDEDKPMNGAARKEHGQSLEQQLLLRNKKLSSELTLLRVSRQELEQQLEALQEEFSRTNAELETSQKLCSTLESDLEKMQEEASNALPSSAMSVAGTYSSRYPHSARRGRSSPTSSIISGYESKSPISLDAIRAGEPVGGGSGILPMIQAQRDRFKQKNAQLEDELSKTYVSVTALRQEVASLQKDNLSLYEKSRYVSAYSRGANSTSSSALSHGPSHSAVQLTPEPKFSHDRYRADYEAKISPFAAFRGRESARAYKRMSFPERIIFSITRMVLATRASRNLFAAYCLALHILIILMLYWTGTLEVERHAKHLGQAVAGAAGSEGLRQVNEADWQLDDAG